MKNVVGIEEISEEQLSYSDDDLYDINSWGADLPFRELITQYEEEDLLKPELQRNYVWTKHEASRFIDSVLLGLPVPSIFLAKEENEKLLIVDGYQRIMTVYDYYRGVFSGDNKSFKLSNTETINEKWRGKTFAELTAEEQRRIKMTTIHAIIFEQKHPNGNTGMYQVFERINTGGKVLKPQEIRNCVYSGEFNKLLIQLNKNSTWRYLLDEPNEDSRMADMELILRFFAMTDIKNSDVIKQNQINLMKYLNIYMGKNRKLSPEKFDELSNKFISAIESVRELLGDIAFRPTNEVTSRRKRKLQPAIFDAISAATVYVKEREIPINYENGLLRYKELLDNEDFKEAITKRTTNTSNIKKRIELASKILYGVKYEW